MLLKIIVGELLLPIPTTAKKKKKKKGEPVTRSIKLNDVKIKTKPNCYFCNSTVLSIKVNLVCYVITNKYLLLINI